MTAAPIATARADRAVALWIFAAAAAAWLALAIAAWTPAKPLLHHAPPGSAGAIGPAVFAAGWLVMVAATMLVPALDFVGGLRRLLAARRRRTGLLLAGMGGFALVWLLIGQLFQVGDAAVHALADGWPWLQHRAQLIPAAALALAGAYQLAPAKRRCLRACRNPAGFLLRGWHGRSPAREVAQIGMAYGWSCAGCCWALMLVMFAAGLASLWLMAALAAIAAVERLLRRPDVAVSVVGWALLVAAALVAGDVVTPFAAS